MQRMIPVSHPLPLCTCGLQPKHWYDASRGGSHFLECSPCGNRTPRFPTLAEAVASWSRKEIRPVSVEPEAPKRSAHVVGMMRRTQG